MKLKLNILILIIALLYFGWKYYPSLLGFDVGILVESTSPNGTLEAFVEQDSGVVYLYMKSTDTLDSLGFSPLWVCNIQPAPDSLEFDRMDGGVAPLMPKGYCKTNSGGRPLKATDLQLVWSKEGDGVALFHKQEPIAIIPFWTGYEDITGFSKECTEPHSLAYPLVSEVSLIAQYKEAQEFWDAWDRDETWVAYQEEMLVKIKREFGAYKQYYAIDGGEWPPRAMVLIEKDDQKLLVTLGLSIRPQPQVSTYFEDYHEYNRFEFAMAFSKDYTEDEILEFGSYISGNSTYPWDKNTFFGNGHTVDCRVVEEYNSVLLTQDMSSIKVQDLGRYDNSRINLLYMVPLKADELQLKMDSSSAKLISYLEAKGVTHITQKKRK